MFFSVSTDIDCRFPNNYQYKNLWVNCDNGWQQTDTTFYKGYDDNYCKIIVDSGGVTIDHSRPRSFPIWYQDGIITNIDSTLTQIWTDDIVKMDTSGKVTVTKIDIDFTVPNKVLTVSQARKRIRQRLDAKLEKVPNNIKLFCSGGIDTVLLYAMLSNRSYFELIVGEHYEQDTFTEKNHLLLNKFWAYNQIHHWNSPSWLATGSQGDEYFLRGYTVVSLLTAWHNINFAEILADNPKSYQYLHFNKYTKLWADTWNNRHRLQEKYPTVELLHNQILNILINDYQHWHLGNTLTWTPFKDIEIAKILLQCPINELIPQFIDARLSKDLIIDYNPDIIDYLSQYKDYNNLENIPKLAEYHEKSMS